MDALIIATAAVAFLAAGCVKGVIGLGLPLTSIAILGSVMNLREAIPLIVIPVLITNVWQIMQGGELVALFRRFWSLNLLMAAGAWGGTVILFMVDPGIMSIVLGVTIIAYCSINLLAFETRVPPGSEPILSPLIGLFSGVLTGVTGSVGAPVAIYMQALGLEKREFLQAISLSFFLTAAAWLIALVDQSAYDRETVLMSIAALVPAFAGMWAGQRIRERLSQERFRRWVFGFLLIVAANLIRKGLV